MANLATTVHNLSGANAKKAYAFIEKHIINPDDECKSIIRDYFKDTDLNPMYLDGWIGNACPFIFQKGYAPDLSLKGEIIKYGINCDEIEIITEDSWTGNHDIFYAVAEIFDLYYCYECEEPGCGIYYSNDPIEFPKYLVNNDCEIEYFEKLQDVIGYLAEYYSVDAPQLSVLEDVREWANDLNKDLIISILELEKVVIAPQYDSEKLNKAIAE